ncbi:PBSX family phage terminase large subunit [Sphingomonas sp. PB4P5]|uniref:PBSX family phage terminase large subunit n=1 Tax=Parasphingomonas puruogangriensis TaxID=3096155 RepID=UPI002FCA0BC0
MLAKVELPDVFCELLTARHADDGLLVRHRAAWGGRGSAKSHSFGSGLVLRGVERPTRILCAREIQRSIDASVKQLLEDKIPAMGFGPTNGDGFFESLKAEIRGRNGTTFKFAGLRTNVDSIKSMEGIDIAYVSEARAVSQNSIQVLTPTVRSPGSEIWWDWNPGEAKDPIDVMFRGGTPPPGSIVRRVNYTENPWFPAELRQEMEWDKQRDPDKYAHIWLGEYQRNSEARVFKNWTTERFETPDDARFYFGADWGFSVDPSVLVRMFIGRTVEGRTVADPAGRTLFIDHEAYAVGCEIDNTPALFDRVPMSRKWPITADSARPETISYMNRQGFTVASAKKGAGSVEDGIEFMKSYDIVVHPRCTHVVDELSLYSWKVDPLTGEVLPVLADKENHTIDAVRYALEATRRAKFDMRKLLT